MNLFLYQLAFASIFYFFAFSASMFSLYKNRKSEGAYFYILGFIGFAIHTWALVQFSLNAQRMPIADSYELMESIAWTLVAVDFLVVLILRFKLLGTLAIFVAFILTALPLFCPVFASRNWQDVPAPANLAGAHAFFAILAYTFLAICAIFSFMYLRQLNALKTRSDGVFTRALLPLPRLIKLSKHFLALSASTLAVSIGIGAFAILGADIEFRIYLKSAIGLVLFLLMLVLLFLSQRKNLSEGVFAKLCIILFVLALILIIPIQVRKV